MNFKIDSENATVRMGKREKGQPAERGRGGSRGRRSGTLSSGVSQFGASCQGARCKLSSLALACFVGRPGQEEEPC